MRRAPSADAARPKARRRILTPASIEFGTSGLTKIGVSPGSNVWPASNDAIAIPFRLSQTSIVDQLGCLNGSSAGGNVDIGIYDASLARLVSTGSTVGSGSNAWQFIDVTDTTLTANKIYYLACSRDTGVGNRQRYYVVGGAAVGIALAGVLDTATSSFPLPDPLAGMAAASIFTILPILAVAFRAPF